MTDHNNDVVLILNARKWGRGDYAIITGMSLFFAAFGLALPYSRITNGPPITRGDVAAFVAFEALILPFWPVLALFCHWMTPRIVRVDDQELAVTTARGRSKCMHWKEIERVFWNSQGLVLRSATTSVGIGWSDFDESARAALQARLEAILSCDFDLTWDPPPHPLDGIEPPWWRSTLKAARVATLGLVLSAVYCLPAYWAVRRDPLNGFNRVAILWGVLTCALLAWAILGAHHESKINPRWRTRRVKAPIAEL